MDFAKKHPREESFRKDRVLSFINRLWNADTLGMFHHPVSASEVPGYYEVIADPIDLSTIKQMIEGGKYTSEAEVEDDVARMISNALEFNEKGSKWHDLALEFRKTYLSLAKQSGLAFDDDSAFIPSKKLKDDESTLRKAEKSCDEELGAVLDVLEKEKEIPLEELRAKYARMKASSEGSEEDDSDEDNDDSSEEDEEGFDSSDEEDSGDEYLDDESSSDE